MSESTAVAVKPKKELKESLAAYREGVARVAAKGFTADYILTCALLTINQSAELQKCTPASIGLAITRIAQWGLIPGATAHLVPFGVTCTPVADYKGLIQLMRECGCRDVDAQVVREGDVFEYEFGLHPTLRHVPNHTRGKITHAYVVVRLPHQVVKFEVMDIAEINGLRQRYSKQWKQGDTPEWYARKTVVRRAAKFVPLHSERLRAALEYDGEAEDIADFDVSEMVVDGAINEHLPLRPAVSRLSTGASEEYGGEPEVKQRVVGTPPPAPEWNTELDGEVFNAD